MCNCFHRFRHDFILFSVAEDEEEGSDGKSESSDDKVEDGEKVTGMAE